MARPLYPYELGDQDFSWLISSFQERFPNYTIFQNGTLPVCFINCAPVTVIEEAEEESTSDGLSYPETTESRPSAESEVYKK